MLSFNLQTVTPTLTWVISPLIHSASDRKKKVKINIEKADIDEIKLEHDLNNTHKTIFNIGLNHIRFWKDDNSVSMLPF